jgi:hypothetical protein
MAELNLKRGAGRTQPDAMARDDLIELLPLSVEAGTSKS